MWAPMDAGCLAVGNHYLLLEREFSDHYLFTYYKLSSELILGQNIEVHKAFIKVSRVHDKKKVGNYLLKLINIS